MFMVLGLNKILSEVTFLRVLPEHAAFQQVPDHLRYSIGHHTGMIRFQGIAINTGRIEGLSSTSISEQLTSFNHRESTSGHTRDIPYFCSTHAIAIENHDP